MMEQRPEFRNVLQRIPVAVTVAVDSSWAMKVSKLILRTGFERKSIID